MNLRTLLSAILALLMLAACQSAPPADEDPDDNNGGGNGGHTGYVPEAPWEARDGAGYAPGRSGEVVTVDLNGQDFSYEVIDGLAIYQADMVLGEADEVAASLAALGSELHTSGSICDHQHIATLFGWFCGRWEDGIVPYSIKDDWATEAINQERRQVIMQAIEHWETHTGLVFVEATGGVRIEFQDGEGCSSRVGRQENIFGNPQPVRLNVECRLSTVIHEIGHAVGLHHEQSRNDRDDYVRIMYDNIESGKSHNFDRAGDSGNDVGEYDYGSVMHYGCYLFPVDGRPTIQPIDPAVTCAMLGGGVLSESDILSVYVMYPPSYSITGTVASYERIHRLEPRIETERTIASRHIHWNIDGSEVATGSTPTIPLFALAEGDHTLTARVVIDGFEVASESVGFAVTNVAPTVTILAPEPGSTYCVDQPIQFRAQVVDGDNPPDFTVEGSEVRWKEVPGGQLGTGKTITRVFGEVGDRTVAVTATDEDGDTATAEIEFSIVHCTSTPPQASITLPSGDFSAFFEDTDEHGSYLDVYLSGSAIDAEDGPLTGDSLEWHTSRGDVQPGGSSLLGTGNVVMARLYTQCGTAHIISLVATDSDGLTGTASRSVYVDNLC